MKQLLIFFIFLITAVMVDMKFIDIPEPESQTITITIQGAVEERTKLTLPLYSTIEDALDQVSIQENADLDQINLLTVLHDRDVVVIPEKKIETQRISINSASLEELITLKGIGSTTASKIIAYRDTHGLFQSLEDLMNVDGIGTAKYEAIKDAITL